TAEKDDSRSDQKIGDPVARGVKGKNDQRNGVNKVVQDGFIPDIDHPMAFQGSLKRVCTECSETDCEKAKSGCYSKKHNGHGLLDHDSRSNGQSFKAWTGCDLVQMVMEA